MAGIVLMFSMAAAASIGGPLLSLGLSFVPPPYGIACAGVLLGASTVMSCFACSTAHSIHNQGDMEGMMVAVFCFFASLLALTIQFVGWIFARILNDDTAGKIASVAISLLPLFCFSCQLCDCECSSGGRKNVAKQQAHQAAQQERPQTQRPTRQSLFEKINDSGVNTQEDKGNGCISVAIPTKTSLDNNVNQDEHDNYARFRKYLSGDNKLVSPKIIDHFGDNVDHNNVDIGMATDGDDMQQISTGSAEKNNRESCDNAELEQTDEKEEQENKCQVSENPNTTVKDEEDYGVDIEMAGDGDK